MKKLIVVGLTAVALTLTGCGAGNDVTVASPYNDRTYCEGNQYTPVDEDDYTCSKNGVVYFEGDHEDDSKKKKKATSKPTTGSGFFKPKPKATSSANKSTTKSWGWNSSSSSKSSSKKK